MFWSIFWLRGRSRFLLLFFAPVALAMTMGAVFNFVTIAELRDFQHSGNADQAGHLQTVVESTQISFEMLKLQRELTSTLARARSGKLDEASTHQFHSDVVDRLALLDGRLERMLAPLGVSIEHQDAREQFAAYRKFALIATDIVAIDPSRAAAYINQANENYYAFAERVQHIGGAMARDSLGHVNSTQAGLDAHTRQANLVTLSAVLFGILVWFFAAMSLSHRLSLLAGGLKQLASGEEVGEHEGDFASISKMSHNPASLIGGMADAVMAFRVANSERSVAQKTLEAERANLERLVSERTARVKEAGEALMREQLSLRLAHDEQRAIFDTVTVGIALLQERIILRCNRRVESMFGYQSGELDGQSTRIWYADEDAFQAAGSEVYGRLSDQTIHYEELELVKKDGSRFWARISGRKFEQTSAARSFLGIIEDISHERAGAEALRKARDMAEEASRAKSSFLANMSHEIRTPMNAIIGMSYLVLKTDLTRRQREYLRKIQGSSQHLLGIINDILDYSKIEAGKLNIEHVDFGLDKVLENVAGLISEKAFSKGLEFVFDVDKSVPNYLVGDPLRLGQILVNYANNAVKFTAEGEIHIKISLKWQSDDEVMLYFAVRDTGIGLTAQQTAQLFQSFQQADDTITRQFGGTGLGLAISKQLAGLMQGEVGVVSEFGQGSTFWFTARLGRSDELPDPIVLSSDLSGTRVLVVDDNESARLLLAEMLTSLKLRVDTADSGSTAIEAVNSAEARQEPYAILFLDWQMPAMTGTALAKRIQELPLSTMPHMVLVTGYGREEVLKGAEQAGIADVLIKPVNASLLFECVARVMGGGVVRSRPYMEPPTATDQALSTIRGARLLLVEDNKLNQEVATELLRDAGFIVDVANNGQVAIDKIHESSFDLVLMDMQMPLMDGLTATRLIRESARFNDLPIVAMTANATPADREACLAAGLNDHVAKPIDPQDLFKSLLKWVKPLDNVGAVPPVSIRADARIDLPEIHGIDRALGLTRVRGNQRFYLSQLRHFLADQSSALHRVQAALDADDWVTAERIAHTLKSTAGNISLASVQQTAAALETAIQQRQGRGDLLALIWDCDGLMRPVLTELQLKLPLEAVDVTEKESTGFDSNQVAVICSQLAALLAQDDMEAGDVLREHESLLRDILGGDFHGVAAAVRRFDYETGLKNLIAAAAERDIKI